MHKHTVKGFPIQWDNEINCPGVGVIFGKCEVPYFGDLIHFHEGTGTLFFNLCPRDILEKDPVSLQIVGLHTSGAEICGADYPQGFQTLGIYRNYIVLLINPIPKSVQILQDLVLEMKKCFDKTKNSKHEYISERYEILNQLMKITMMADKPEVILCFIKWALDNKLGLATDTGGFILSFLEYPNWVRAEHKILDNWTDVYEILSPEDADVKDDKGKKRDAVDVANEILSQYNG